MVEMSAANPHRDLEIALLRRRGLGNAEIAEALQCHRNTVVNATRRGKKKLAETEARLLRYQGPLGKRLPDAHRVERLASVINQNGQPMVVLKAIQYVDRVLGAVPESVAPAAPQRGPLFELPPGTRVAIAIERKSE